MRIINHSEALRDKAISFVILSPDEIGAKNLVSYSPDTGYFATVELTDRNRLAQYDMAKTIHGNSNKRQRQLVTKKALK